MGASLLPLSAGAEEPAPGFADWWPLREFDGLRDYLDDPVLWAWRNQGGGTLDATIGVMGSTLSLNDRSVRYADAFVRAPTRLGGLRVWVEPGDVRGAESVGYHYQQKIVGEDGGRQLLRLGNAFEQAALVVGHPEVAIWRTSLTLSDLTISGAGSVLVQPAATLSTQRTSWFHGGALAIGATAPQGPAASTLSITDGSVFARLPGADLDIAVGSAGAGRLQVQGNSALEASSLVVGAGTAGRLSTVLIDQNSSLRIDGAVQVGRYGAGSIELGSDGWAGSHAGLSTLTAARMSVGQEVGAPGSFTVNAGGSAALTSLDLGRTAGSLGTLLVRPGVIRGGGPPAPAGALVVDQALEIGGSGQGMAAVSGTLSAGRMRIVGWGPDGLGRLESEGPVSITGDAELVGRASWISRASTTVGGRIEVGLLADDNGSLAELRVESGSRLAADRVSIGDYSARFDGLTGKVVVTAGSTLDADMVNVYASGLLGGRGTVAGTVFVNGGTISPGESPGRLIIDGDLRFSGRLLIEIGGLAPGTGHDVLEVLGGLNLGDDAVLELRELDGFELDRGHTLNFLRAASIDGQFARVDDFTGLGLTLDDFRYADGIFGFNPDPHVSPPAVPEPSAYALMLLGLAGVSAAARRRIARPLAAG